MKKYIKPLLLPIIFSVFPSIFYYANNAELIRLISLARMLAFNLLLAISLYIIFLLISKKEPKKASLATFAFLIFFNTYGIFYKEISNISMSGINHNYLLPLYTLLGIITVYAVFKIRDDISINLWRILFIVFTIFCAFNLLRIIPVEIRKIQRKSQPINKNLFDETKSENFPDIYYLVFDEFAGFEAMRDYWQNQDIEDFVNYLSEKGFFIAEESYSTKRTGDTMHQMAMRLNFQIYPGDNENRELHYQAIAENKVMNYLKQKGYTTMTFDDVRGPFGYPAKPPINADINYENSPELGRINSFFYFDEFGTLVADRTMMIAFSKYYRVVNPAMERHINMIHFTSTKLANLSGENPIFVYVHLLFPHTPFMFDESGEVNEPEFYQNWDYYLGNYQYSVKVIKNIVDQLISISDPSNPPVIILQSDHGARIPESAISYLDQKVYPEAYKALILNAIYLPQCVDPALTQDMDPINTFPILFNCLFDENIALH